MSRYNFNGLASYNLPFSASFRTRCVQWSLGKDVGRRMSRYGWEGNQHNSSQPRWWGHSQHPISKDSKISLEQIRKSLYEKEVVSEETILWFTYERRFWSAEASQHV